MEKSRIGFSEKARFWYCRHSFYTIMWSHHTLLIYERIQHASNGNSPSCTKTLYAAVTNRAVDIFCTAVPSPQHDQTFVSSLSWHCCAQHYFLNLLGPQCLTQGTFLCTKSFGRLQTIRGKQQRVPGGRAHTNISPTDYGFLRPYQWYNPFNSQELGTVYWENGKGGHLHQLSYANHHT